MALTTVKKTGQKARIGGKTEDKWWIKRQEAIDPNLYSFGMMGLLY